MNRFLTAVGMVLMAAAVAFVVYLFYLQNDRIGSLEAALAVSQENQVIITEEKEGLKEEVDRLEQEISELNLLLEEKNEIDVPDRFDEKAYAFLRESIESILQSRAEPAIETQSLLDLSPKELEAFEQFQSDRDDIHLMGLSPLSIMKLYLHAEVQRDFLTQYYLYYLDNQSALWSLEEHLAIPNEDRVQDFGVFENASRVVVWEQGNLANVSWYSDHFSEAYDEDAWQYYFHLTRNENNVWKVNFIPMQ